MEGKPLQDVERQGCTGKGFQVAREEKVMQDNYREAKMVKEGNGCQGEAREWKAWH